MSATSELTDARCGRMRMLFATALLSLCVSGVMAADVAAPATPASPSQRLQQRFAASVEGWRKLGAKLPNPQPHEAELVRELRVVVAPTAVPLLRAQRRLNGHTIVVSVGWLALLDELLRAEAASAEMGARCVDAYAVKILDVVGTNRQRAGVEPMQAWPRFASWLDSDDAPQACKAGKAAARYQALQARVDEETDAAALWLLMHLATPLLALPVPPVAAPTIAASAAKTASAASAAQVSCTAPTCRAHAAQPAVAATDASMTSTQRSWLALACYGLRRPAALSWLQANAAELFDEQTARALSY